jgi:excisionase family DNA binding protein
MTKFADLPNKTLLRPDEVAIFFSVSVKTVYGWVEIGKLEVSRASGKSLRIYRDSVLKLAKRG